jgi:hypothetical protein
MCKNVKELSANFFFFYQFIDILLILLFKKKNCCKKRNFDFRISSSFKLVYNNKIKQKKHFQKNSQKFLIFITIVQAKIKKK